MTVPTTSTKPHFEILDGLRGVAALAVVIFHFMEIAVPDPNKNFIAHAYLAVDFFFCLSGFVIAYAYDQKIATIGIWEFMKRRLIRLHPLVVIGSVIGLLLFIFDPLSDLYQSYTGKTLQLFICSCLMIPYPIVPERYFNLFHLNPPTWSLFWEYVANFAYATVLFRFRNKILWVLTIVAAALLFYEAKRSNHLSIGWGGDNIRGGAIRVAYSFLAGMLTYRCGWIIKSKLGFISLSALLLVALLFPFSDKSAWLLDPLLATFYFPFLVALGAGARKHEATQKSCRLSGALSYPLYMVHYPFIWLFMSWVLRYKPNMTQMSLVTVVGTLLMILLAYAVMRWADMPLRAWLTRKTTTATRTN